MQEEEVVAGFLNHHLEVGQIRLQGIKLVELVVFGREHSARLQIAGKVFAHRPGDGEVIEGGRAPADLIRYTKERSMAC